MNEIDFLPDGFVSRRDHLQRVVRLVVLLSLVCIVMGGWYVSERRALGQLQEFLTAAKTQQVALTKTKVQFIRLQQRADQLRKVWHIRRQLTPAVASTAVLGTLTQLTPQSITLTKLTMEQPRPPTPRLPPATRTHKQTTRNRPWTFITIGLEGLTPSGVDLANLIGAIEEHPMFEHIELKDSQSTRAHGLIAQAFRLTMRVPVNCDYLPTSQQPRAAAIPVAQEWEVPDAP